MKLVDLRFYDQRPGAKLIDVGSGIVIALWPNGDIGMEHVCKGIYHGEEEEETEYLICALWKGDLICEDPLTLNPSLLCLGAGLPCGLHGFVTEGVWQPCE